jgi:uncharacterized protein (DUF983 family)
MPTRLPKPIATGGHADPPSGVHDARPIWPAMKRGLRQRCPSCGTGSLYGKYLKVVDACAVCGTELHHQRADDAPPYITMFITGHVIVAALLMVERQFAPPEWAHLVIWLPVTALLTLWLLPRIKGALIAIQWAARMHGFETALHGNRYPDPAHPEVWAGDTLKKSDPAHG